MKTLKLTPSKTWLNLLFAGFTLFLSQSIGYSATVNSTGNGNWEDGATWDGSVPGAGDTANIQPAHTVTVTSNATISVVTITSDNDDGSALEINSGIKLTVSDVVEINAGGFNNSLIQVYGELEAQSDINFANSTGIPTYARIEMKNTTSKLTILGTLNNHGTNGEIFTNNRGNVEFNISSDMDIPELFYDYYNLTLSGNSTKSLANNLIVDNNLVINSSTTLDVTANNYSLSVGGNWINNGGTFNARNATVTFNGTGAQQITSNGNDFYNATFNNTASGITLNDNMVVQNTCTLTDGVVSTGANWLIMEATSGASLSGGSNGSFVNGNLRRYITSNTDVYAFPVGNGTATTNYYRADIVNANMTNVTYIDASFGALSNHDDADLNAADSWIDFNSVHTTGVWTLTPSGQPSGGSYDVRLYIENVSGLSDNSFAPLKRPEGSDGSNWTAPGTLSGDGGEGRLAAESYTLRLGLTSFSEFGIGTGTPTGNALPIELLSFSAEKNTSDVNLNWVTATEINNDYFTLERSEDGKNFKAIEKVEGAGNSTNTLEYNYLDRQPASGENYYRLKQTDFDGTFTYSEIVSVNFGTVVTAEKAKIYPNPGIKGNAINIDLPDGISDATTVEIFSAANGQLIFSQEIGTDSREIDIPSGISSGLYLVRMQSGNWNENQKLLIQ